MKKFLLFGFIVSTFFFSISFLNADCESVVKDADKIKVSRVEDFPNENDSDLYSSFIGLEIANIPDNLYVVITNDYNNDSITINSQDLKDGVYRYPAPYIYKIVNYEVKIYSKDESCTSTDSVKVFNPSTRIVNEYFYHNKCLDNRDLEICKPVLDKENVNTTEFNKQIEEAIKVKNKTFLEKIGDFFMKYYLYFIVPIILISIVGIVRIIILKRGNKND